MSNAFLHGNLKESVFMVQPLGFEDPSKPNHVCHLHKSLYRLKQAHIAQYDKLTTALQFLGFLGSQNDHSLFVKNDPALEFVLIHVDDIVVTGPNAQLCQDVISHLNGLFRVKYMGSLHYFLGIEVKKSSSGIFLTQTKYILYLLKKANMDCSKPCVTSLSTSRLDHKSPLLANPEEGHWLVDYST